MAAKDDLQEVRSRQVFLKEEFQGRKLFPGEVAPDEFADSVMKGFEINVFNVVYDTTTLQSIEKGFASHKDLYQNLSLLCPTRFSEIAQLGVP